MKMMTGVLALIMSANVWSAPVNMACITEFPTTSFVALTENDTINFRLIHHNGTKYMPVWNNVITPNDLSIISDAADLLSELGPELNFTMPEKNCEVMDGMLMNCFGNSPEVVMNGHKVNLWAVHTKEVTETSFAGTYEYVITSMALEIDGKTLHVPMKYGSHECFKDFYSKNLRQKIKTKNVFLK